MLTPVTYVWLQEFLWIFVHAEKNRTKTKEDETNFLTNFFKAVEATI